MPFARRLLVVFALSLSCSRRTLATLRSGHPAISVPQSVVVAAGAQTAAFPVTTTSVADEFTAECTNNRVDISIRLSIDDTVTLQPR
jgi:hypothetical protein